MKTDTIIVLFWAILLLFLSYKEIFKKQSLNNVSLPEEIILAKKGDTLIVEKVSDSIYIGFKH